MTFPQYPQSGNTGAWTPVPPVTPIAPRRGLIIWITLFFGLFGLIPTMSRANQARQLGYPARGYWAAFWWTFGAITIAWTVIWILVISAAGTAATTALPNTINSASAPAASSQPETQVNQPQLAPVTTHTETPQATQPVTTSAAPTTPAVPPQEQQAIAAAQDYLAMEGFSRNGLINQLSSSAGDDFPKAIATQAVDSLNVDWNAQAVRAANSYLQVEHFSCAGLIQQLESSAGDQFTASQASYGAHQTSACQ